MTEEKRKVGKFIRPKIDFQLAPLGRLYGLNYYQGIIELKNRIRDGQYSERDLVDLQEAFENRTIDLNVKSPSHKRGQTLNQTDCVALKKVVDGLGSLQSDLLQIAKEKGVSLLGVV